MAKFQAKFTPKMWNIFYPIVAINASLLFGEYSPQLVFWIA